MPDSKPRQSLSRIVSAAGEQGFTLVEVMLAMVITAFVGVLAYQGLSAAMTAEEVNRRQLEYLADIQLPLTVLERDIRNAVDRSIIDEYGNEQPAMSGGELFDSLLRLTRSGWTNPRGLPRGELQRVRYVLENRELWRESWMVLDRLSLEAGQQRTLLLENVERIQLSFLDPGSSGAGVSDLGGEWIESWDKDDPAAMPLAVDIRIELEGLGELHRVFSIPVP